MKRLFVFGLAVALLSGTASASLIGDEIRVDYDFNSFHRDATVVVGPGVEILDLVMTQSSLAVSFPVKRTVLK